MMDILSELRFWTQTIEDSRRTLICPAGLGYQLRDLLDQRGVAGLYDVQESPHVGEHILVVDHNTIDAATRQASQRAGRALT